MDNDNETINELKLLRNMVDRNFTSEQKKHTKCELAGTVLWLKKNNSDSCLLYVTSYGDGKYTTNSYSPYIGLVDHFSAQEAYERLSTVASDFAKEKRSFALIKKFAIGAITLIVIICIIKWLH